VSLTLGVAALLETSLVPAQGDVLLATAKLYLFCEVQR